MKILVAKASKLIEDGDFNLVQHDFLWQEFEDQFENLIKKSIVILKDNFEKNQLALVENQITDLDNLKVNLFTNIINLPYSYAKKYVDFFEDF